MLSIADEELMCQCCHWLLIKRAVTLTAHYSYDGYNSYDQAAYAISADVAAAWRKHFAQPPEPGRLAKALALAEGRRQQNHASPNAALMRAFFADQNHNGP